MDLIDMNSGTPNAVFKGGNGLRILARIIHEGFTAAAHLGMSAALRSVGFLDVLSSTPVESSRRAPCIHAHLHRLATNLHE
jgi:hypothetical protein